MTVLIGTGAGVDRHYILDAAEVDPGESRPVTVGTMKLLVCHTGGEYYVIRNQCSHAMARLSGGKLRGHKIFCPLHSAAFDLRDGRALAPPATEPIPTYTTTVDDGKIFAELPAEAGEPA